MQMVFRYRPILSLLALVLLLVGCSTTKFVPQDKYLLNKAKVTIEGTKEVTPSNLTSYMRQKPNSEIFGFWKLQLLVYNTAPSDTTTKANKWLARNAHKIGEAPEIYDPALTRISQQQIRQAMFNRGFFRATVDTLVSVKDRKLKLEYHVTSGTPSVITEYETDIENEQVERIARQSSSLVKRGMIYNAGVLDDERQRITTEMRNRGYYYFDKSLIEYEADSASLGEYKIALTMKLSQYLGMIPDSIRDKIYTSYTIRHVHFYLDYDPQRLDDSTQVSSYTDDNGYSFSYVGPRFLRESVLRRRCSIRPGVTFSERRLERAYSNLNGLGPLKYVNISFVPVDSSKLDCHVTLTRSKINSVSAELGGTYSGGDWGVAAGLGYVNKNIFRGAEQLTLNGRASYEWRANGGRAIEGKGEIGLQFPSNVKLNISYNYQQRPDEYTRTIANAGLQYTVPRSPRAKWSHRFNLINISYLRLPWISEDFKTNFIDQASLLKASYEDHFIVGWSYSGQYSNYNQRNTERSYVNLNYSIETAGNLLYGICAAAGLPRSAETGAYEIWKIPFAQYVKGDINFTFNQRLADRHRMVYHAGIGVAVPFGNATTIPFEKRYFSGGANSVRGWQARTLGPGQFSGGNGNTRVYDQQAGDIRLDLNLEYRWKVWKYLELAAFTDAGNVWTIRDYGDVQQGGVFSKDFYRQIAWSYGAGVRIDLSVFVFRIDMGVKLYDPSRLDYGSQWRIVRPSIEGENMSSYNLNWHDDFTFHFAIGYPF